VTTRRRGFTLIEVMAVVALLGLLAGATVWSITSDADRATQSDATSRLTHVDAMARLAARRFAGTTLHIDLAKQAVWYAPLGIAPDAADADPRSQSTTMPGRHRIARVWLVELPKSSGTVRAAPRVEQIDSGQVAISVSANGHSTTYALEVVGPSPAGSQANTNNADYTTVWLLFAGLSGQATTHHDEKTIQDIFARLAGTRADAG